mgnify:CR=1 FL=1
MPEHPKILFSPKDAPFINSGYGIITRHLVPRLAAHYGKDNILVFAPVFQRDEVRDWDGVKILPGLSTAFGEDVIYEHYVRQKCNILLQVGDWAPLRAISQLASENKVLWVQYAPMDFLNLPQWAFDILRFAHKVVPFTKQAEKAFKGFKLQNVSEAIWIGLDSELWKPLDRREFPNTMQSLGFSEDSYNLLIVAANQNRKYLRETLEGIRHFVEAYPQANTKVYFHTRVHGERQLDQDIQELGLQDKVSFPDPYDMLLGGIDESQLVIVFNCADLVLDVTMEGFGMAQSQAQACGVPVVCMSEGGGPELVKWGVEVPSYSIDRSQPLLKPVPHPAQIATAIETMYLAYREGKRKSETASKWAREVFSWDVIAEQWIKLIDQVMEEREKYSLYVPRPSEELMRRSREMVEL